MFEDRVRLKLDGIEVPIVKNYTVHAGVLEVPAAFTMTLGHSGLIAELAAAFPPFTPFELLVGDVKVQTGETDEFSTGGSLGSDLDIAGRDMLKWLVDTQIRSERTFAERTFLQLVEASLEACGLDNTVISLSNDANRKAITGVQNIRELAPAKTEETTTETGVTEGAQRVTYRTIKAEVGTTWFEFIVAQLRRAGLFLWADVEGSFILNKPTGLQTPLYRILRRRTPDGSPAAVNVLGPPTFSHNVVGRYTECQVFGRGGGGKAGRAKATARHFDDEMIALLNPNENDRKDGGKRQKPLIVRDDQVRTAAQAAFLARRKIAESRRASWRLSYKVRGHSAPALTGGGRAIWQPDTVAEVIDDELGIEGPMYVESVVYHRQPETTTEINLLRIEDLVFAEEDVEATNAGRRPGLQKIRRGVTQVEHIRSETHEIWMRSPNWGGLPVRSQPTRGR